MHVIQTCPMPTCADEGRLLTSFASDALVASFEPGWIGASLELLQSLAVQVHPTPVHETIMQGPSTRQPLVLIVTD